MKNWRNALTVSVLLFIIILLTVSLFFYGLHTRNQLMLHRMNAKYVDDMNMYRKVKAELNAKIEEQKWSNTDLSQQVECLEDKLREIRKNIANAQNDNTSPDEWNIKDSILETAIIEKCHRLALEGKTISDSDWRQLRTVVNLYLPDFLQSLNQFEYKMTLRETNVCILVKLRFLPSEIGFLLKMSPSNLSNLRSRLHKSLFGTKGSTTDFDDKIRVL